MTTAPPTLSEIIAGGSGGALTLLRAQVWEQFVVHALDAIDQAMAVLAVQGLGYDHEAEATYWRRRTRMVASVETKLPEEDSITDVLTRALERIRERSRADSFIRRNQICFPAQQPRQRQRRLGPHARTTDIQIRSLNRTFLDLRIEAKVLFDQADVKHYCGTKGLLRFSDPEPYTDQPVGMMLGYSLHRDARWITDIEVASRSNPQVRSFSDVRVGVRTMRMSVSARHCFYDVSVLHLFLLFRSNPDAR